MYACIRDSLSSQVPCSQSLPHAVSVHFCAAALCPLSHYCAAHCDASGISILSYHAQTRYLLGTKSRGIIHTYSLQVTSRQSRVHGCCVWLETTLDWATILILSEHNAVRPVTEHSYLNPTGCNECLGCSGVHTGPNLKAMSACLYSSFCMSIRQFLHVYETVFCMSIRQCLQCPFSRQAMLCMCAVRDHLYHSVTTFGV